MLTKLEEAEFTHLNCVAYDQYRKTASEKGQIPCCWLTMSDEAREEARQTTLALMAASGFGSTLTAENFDSRLTSGMKSSLVNFTARWRGMEEQAKQMREAGNPLAFFMG